MAKPLMSIGMIFKNDIRCIERCMKALQPLREAVPCELVMADTGSTDGSREIAEKYADILIDFPWIDDFAAARNAVMDRCSGVWHFTVDTDEYLDPDVSELVEFLCNSDECQEMIAVVNVRNYNTYDMAGDYSDFSAGRILRMSSGMRYEGAVHEHLNCSGAVEARQLSRTMLHHDGYADMRSGGEKGKEKTQRNVRMIKKELEKSPESLVLWMQLIEAGSKSTMPDYEEQLRHAVHLVREKKPGWGQIGPPILRSAIYIAEQLDLPEWEEWLKLAEDWFPESMFTRLDIQYAAFVHDWNEGKDPDKALRRGEQYLKALQDYRSGADPLAQVMSPLQMATPFSECEAKIHMINGYCTRGRFGEAFNLAEGLDYMLLNEDQINKFISALQDIHFRSTMDTAPVIMRIWELASGTEQASKKAELWRTALIKAAGRTFLRKNRDAERKKADFVRYAYSLYCPLRGKFEVGTAAAIMGMQDRTEIELALAEVEDWDAFSICALAHALECGAHFPLPDKPLNIEEMDSLASRLAKDKEQLFPLALRTVEQLDSGNCQDLLWARGMVMSAVRAFPWDGQEQDREKGFQIARAFARVEGEFLPLCYSEGALQEDKLFMLPPMHRFGWYCAQAFEELEQGEFSSCIKSLRAGLSQYSNSAKMVDFLLGRVADLERNARIAAAPPELIGLADQIKVILARFAPDAPAVIELKKSPEYQQVAWLIEKPDQPAFSNIPQ